LQTFIKQLTSKVHTHKYLQTSWSYFFALIARNINLRQRNKYVNVERLAASNEFWLDPLMEFDVALGEITINAKMMILCLMLSLFKFAFLTIESSFCLRRPSHFKIDDPNRIKENNILNQYNVVLLTSVYFLRN